MDLVNSSGTSELQVYSNDYSLVGQSKTVVVTASLTNYPSVTGPDFSITITFVECYVAESTVALPQIAD